MMKALSAQRCVAHVNNYSRGLVLPNQVNENTHIRGLRELVKKSNNVFANEEDEKPINPALNKAVLLQSFSANVSSLVHGTAVDTTGVGQNAVVASNDEPQSVADLIEEREKKM